MTATRRPYPAALRREAVRWIMGHGDTTGIAGSWSSASSAGRTAPDGTRPVQTSHGRLGQGIERRYAWMVQPHKTGPVAVGGAVLAVSRRGCYAAGVPMASAGAYVETLLVWTRRWRNGVGAVSSATARRITRLPHAMKRGRT